MKQSERTELTVSRIMNAALEEFGSNGYAGGTINGICKRGINKGLVYHNFRNRDELYLACLDRSCKRLVQLIEESGCGTDPLKYMNVRLRFFAECRHEARIFFEAVLQPQEALRDRIQAVLQPFEQINESIYRSVVAGLALRDGVTAEDAVAYFRQMQQMFNGYFSSAAWLGRGLDERIRNHEKNLARLLDFMIYGIAEGGRK